MSLYKTRMPTDEEIARAVAYYQKQKEASRRYYQANKEKVAERRKAKYHEAHPEAKTRNRRVQYPSSSPLGDEPCESVVLPTSS